MLLPSVWTLARIHDYHREQSPGERKEPPRPEGRDRIAGADGLPSIRNARRFESIVATKVPEFVVPRVTVKQRSFVTTCSVPQKAIHWEDKQSIHLQSTERL